MHNPVLADWLARIERGHPSAIALGLDRVRPVYERLQVAPRALSIIVAGTNGKGSVCAMLDAVASADGYRVGRYTSPHLLHFNERIRIDGQPVEDDRLLAAFEAVEQARQDVSLTYFEFTTLAALWCFARADLDLLVLEVGLGGRLDAVNLIDADCAIVTSVALDHQDWLGDSRESIGAEKAGVFRAGRPAICGDPSPPQSIVAHAADVGADLWLHGRDFDVSGDRRQWNYRGRSQRRNAIAYPALRGANQLINAAAVLAAFEALRAQLPLSQQAVREGFARATLTGRFEIVPGRPSLVLDVAHNPHAAAHLAANLDQMGFFPVTHGVIAIRADKDIDGVLDALDDRIDHWWVCPLNGPGGAQSQVLRDKLVARGCGLNGERTVSVAESVAQGLAGARAAAAEEDRIVVFGSFLTVGEALLAEGRDKIIA